MSRPRNGGATDLRSGSRTLVVVVSLVVLALVATTVTVIALAARDRDALAGLEPGGTTTQEWAGSPAAGLDETGGVAVGDGGPVLTVYLDLLCPACRQLEETSGEYLRGLEASGEATVDYRPIAILDRLSAGTEYSTRAASAVMCVADTDGPATAVDVVDALYAAQPAEGGPGLDDAALAEVALGAGASEAVRLCIEETRYAGWVARSTQQAQQLGVGGTPTVWVDGQPTTARTPEALAGALRQAGG
ncbi:DsbA family protein [Aquipuribacter sp. SD81]|uniref:DsbA family protein n=1 Tax=Aquipuribacter sp. SD81 TaxID=3127703 RepID=UPI003016B192